MFTNLPPWLSKILLDRVFVSLDERSGASELLEALQPEYQKFIDAFDFKILNKTKASVRNLLAQRPAGKSLAEARPARRHSTLANLNPQKNSDHLTDSIPLTELFPVSSGLAEGQCVRTHRVQSYSG